VRICSLRSEDHPGSWLSTTPPARQVESETRAPATLVDATFHAIADAGSIPAVSTSGATVPDRPVAVVVVSEDPCHTRHDRVYDDAEFPGPSRPSSCIAEREVIFTLALVILAETDSVFGETLASEIPSA
jgi:hypothetical protein